MRKHITTSVALALTIWLSGCIDFLDGVPCTTTAECLDYQCIEGRCALPHSSSEQRTEAPSVEGQSCDPNPCDQGLACVAESTGGRCRRACNPDAPACRVNEACASLQNGGGVCIAAAQEGESCASTRCATGLLCIDASCHRSCSPAQSDCGSGKICAELQGGGGACIEVAGEGENCRSKRCSSGLVCTEGACRRSCQPSSPSACLSTEVCSPLTNGEAACYQAAAEGQACDNGLCRSGLLCVENHCRRQCGTGFSSCASGESCTALSSGQSACFPAAGDGESCASMPCASGLLCVEGSCHRSCNQAVPNCRANEKCSPITGGGAACFLAASEGESCWDMQCADGLVCVGSSAPRCYVSCNPSSPDCPAGKTCSPIGGGGGACE